MKITKEENVLHVKKPEGLDVRYYLFDEYEVHYDEQEPRTKQVWHYHEHIHETIYIIEGELVVFWKDGSKIKQLTVKAGDLVETEHTDHNFENQTDGLVKFLVLKQVLAGKSKKEILKNDKILTNH